MTNQKSNKKIVSVTTKHLWFASNRTKAKKHSVSAGIITFFFVLSICFFGAGAPKAQAVWGVGDVTFDYTNWVQNTITAGSAPVTAGASTAGAVAGTANFAWSSVGKNLLDYAAYAAAQNLLNQLTQNTIKWIQGGFRGSPSYAVDTNQMFTEIADNIAGGMILSLRNIAVCDFKANYKDDLTNAVYMSTKQRPYVYNQKATCPFKQEWNFTAKEFYAGTSRFAWDAFGAALEDSGNPYGIQTVTAKEMAEREEKAKADKEKKLSWSNGFADIIDPSSCNYPAHIFYYAGDIKPVDYASGSVSTSDTMTAEEASAKNKELLSDPSFVKSIQDQYCKTTTPGKIVGDQLTKTLGIDMDRIGFADNMNKIVSAFLDQITQKTIRGVFGKGDSSVSTGSIGGAVGLGGVLGSAGTGPAHPVIVTTTPAGATNITQTTATIKGEVTYAGTEANVRVWFRWSEAPFTRESTTPTWTASPNPPISHSEPTSNQPQTFSAPLTRLTPGTKYYYQANAATSQIVNDPNSLRGEVLQFTTEL